METLNLQFIHGQFRDKQGEKKKTHKKNVVASFITLVWLFTLKIPIGNEQQNCDTQKGIKKISQDIVKVKI